MPSMLAVASRLYSASFGGTDATAAGAAGRSLCVAGEVVVASDATRTTITHARSFRIVVLHADRARKRALYDAVSGLEVWIQLVDSGIVVEPTVRAARARAMSTGARFGRQDSPRRRRARRRPPAWRRESESLPATRGGDLRNEPGLSRRPPVSTPPRSAGSERIVRIRL